MLEMPDSYELFYLVPQGVTFVGGVTIVDGNNSTCLNPR